ncbi:MAG: hypothetical protein H6755_00225 [Candidatus Omnitrophica bacterium]|nr:hypothetical protein [Candidatus Omnitrophota bacterium]
MNQIELIIKSNDKNSLMELKRIIYSQKLDLLIEEEYDHSPGYNKEPITITIIATLGAAGAFTAAYKMFDSYMKYKTEKLKIETEKEKHELTENLKHERALLELEVINNEKSVKMNEDEFLRLKDLKELEKVVESAAK